MPRISCALCRCKKKGLRRETGRGLFLRKGEIMEILRAANAEIAMRRILQAAVSEKASDVHLEPCREFVLVRFRIDGTLTERYRLPLDMAAGLSVRAKVLGGMDVGENRIPQDGSFSEIRDEKNTDFRLSVMPSVYGETIVIRILSGQMDFIEKNELGMLPLQKKIFRTKIGKKSGMILTTGPTGSGKTSTLYAALKLVCRPEISVISVEDPVEYRIPGITQVEVNEKAGLTFERGLRSLVRQDPDVVMIGEIRDRETAEIAVHAALTGHLVLSTLHSSTGGAVQLNVAEAIDIKATAGNGGKLNWLELESEGLLTATGAVQSAAGKGGEALAAGIDNRGGSSNVTAKDIKIMAIGGSGGTSAYRLENVSEADAAIPGFGIGRNPVFPLDRQLKYDIVTDRGFPSS